MKFSIIVATDRNGGIGHNNKIPWHQPADLKRFRELTMNHPLILGRKTWESIGRPLPGRTMIVLSATAVHGERGLPQSGVLLARDIKQAIEMASQCGERAFIAGGEQIYSLFMNRVDRIYLTIIDGDFACDRFFHLPTDKWEICEQAFSNPDEKNPLPMQFLELRRV